MIVRESITKEGQSWDVHEHLVADHRPMEPVDTTEAMWHYKFPSFVPLNQCTWISKTRVGAYLYVCSCNRRCHENSLTREGIAGCVVIGSESYPAFWHANVACCETPERRKPQEQQERQERQEPPKKDPVHTLSACGTESATTRGAGLWGP